MAHLRLRGVEAAGMPLTSLCCTHILPACYRCALLLAFALGPLHDGAKIMARVRHFHYTEEKWGAHGTEKGSAEQAGQIINPI